MLSRVLAAIGALATFASAQVSYFSASLDGAQEVPPVATAGLGWGVVRLEEPANSVRVFVHAENLTAAPTAAHLHMAPLGVNGGVIVPLAAGPSPTTFTGGAVLSAAQVAALKTSGTYLNVHTGAFPGGEIRGQVVTPSTWRFTSILNGLQEVPPVPSNATGEGVAFLHEPDNRLVYVVRCIGLGTVTAAHIHQAASGVNGPVVHGLIGGGGSYCGVTPKLTTAQVNALKANGMYFNVHTTTWPGGEIRGQILLTRGDDFLANCNGAQEVPPNTTNGRARACLQIQPNGQVTYRVEAVGLTGPPTAAHVHVAAPGINGPVVFPLSGGPSVWMGTSPVLTTTQLNDCRGGNWYVNIHTAAFPTGELRGQVQPLRIPTVFGGSCQGSNGIRPQIAADGGPCVGGGFRIQCHGGIPGGVSILNLGASRDASGGTPLPIEFTTLGFPAPNCFFLVSPGSTVVHIADPMGCSHHQQNIPFNTALIGLVVYAQWYLFDPPANAFGLTSSNAMTLELQ